MSVSIHFAGGTVLVRGLPPDSELLGAIEVVGRTVAVDRCTSQVLFGDV